MAIVLYSKNYMNSAACLNEAGAIWIKDIPFYPIILPDFSFGEIRGFLNPNITVFRIDDKYKLMKYLLYYGIAYKLQIQCKGINFAYSNNKIFEI